MTVTVAAGGRWLLSENERESKFMFSKFYSRVLNTQPDVLRGTGSSSPLSCACCCTDRASASIALVLPRVAPTCNMVNGGGIGGFGGGWLEHPRR